MRDITFPVGRTPPNIHTLICATAPTMTHLSDEENDRTVKNSWTPEEDALLREQIKKSGGPGNWTAIAEALDGRSSKSCRLRWCNQLNPSVKRGPFTEEEDRQILAAHAIHGNKWAVISRSISGRTDNQVKNRFNSTLRRVFASQRRGEKSTSSGRRRVAAGSKKRKGSSASRSDADGRKRSRTAAADSGACQGAPSAPTGRYPLAKLFSGRVRGADRSADRGSGNDSGSVSEDEDNEDEPDYHYGSDSGDDETITGLEQLVQASLEVERMERRREIGGSGGSGGEQQIKRDAEDVVMQGDSSVRGANSFVDNAHLHVFAKVHQQHQQRQESVAGGFIASFPGACSAAPEHLQRYPSFHSGATAAVAKDSGEEMDNNNNNNTARADSPTSSGCNFSLQHGAQGAGAAMNPLVMQILLLQQQQQQQEQQRQQQQQQQQQRHVNPILQLLLSSNAVNSGGFPALALGGGVKASEGREGSGLSASDTAAGMMAMAGSHYWYAQMQGLHGMMMGGVNGVGAAEGMGYAQAAAAAAAAAPEGMTPH